MSECRLLYLIAQLGTGGAERQLVYLLRSMDRERYQPAVVVWNDSSGEPHLPYLRGLGVPCYALPSGRPGPAKMRALRQLVQQLQPEVVHSYSFYTNVAVQWATQRTSMLPIGSLRGEFSWTKRDTGNWLGNLSARWPQTQIYNSLSAFNEIKLARGFFVPRRPFVVCNALDLDRFKNVPIPQQRRPLIVGVGSLLPVKRWDRLIAAARRLKDRGLEFIVRIVGDGPLRSSLTDYARELDVTDVVEIPGNNNDIPGVLGEANFLVHTSESEGCPNAVMEAMACGRAVVATDTGDIPALIEEGSSGFIVSRTSAEMLALRMETLIADPTMCWRMGNVGRAKAARDFNLARLVSETLAVYRAVGWKDN